MYMVGLGKHADLDRICPKISPDIGVVHLVRMVEIVIMDSSLEALDLKSSLCNSKFLIVSCKFCFMEFSDWFPGWSELSAALAAVRVFRNFVSSH
jgi:hypothetical protein